MSTIDDLNYLDFPVKVAACHLNALESQAIFTIMLNSIARPGTIHQLPHNLIGRIPSVVAPVVTLADVETRVHVMDHSDFQWQDAICSATGAIATDISNADLLVMTSKSLCEAADVFERARVGSAFTPELGARMFIDVLALGNDESMVTKDIPLALSGPGVKGESFLTVGGLTESAIDAWIRTNSHFPSGIDVWLTTESGQVAGIPRSTLIRIVKSRPKHGGH